MVIAIYGEPLKVSTSANPGRGMLIELIKRRKNDSFHIVFFNKLVSSGILTDFFGQLENFENWDIVISKKNKWFEYLKAVIGIQSNDLKVKADLYLNPDCTTLGKKGHPLIVTVADFSVFKGRKYSSFGNLFSFLIRKRILRSGIKSSDLIVSISKNTLDELKAYFPNESKKAKVVYNGIDPLWFNSKRLINTNENYWIWWGQISARKNLENLLKAYALLIKKEIKNIPDFKIIYSNAEIPEHLKELIKELGVSSKVKFERRKNLWDLINDVTNSQGLLFVSKVEGFGVPIIEAMATGIPVLTSNCSSMPEISGNCAILCDPFDVNSIMEGLILLMGVSIEDNCSRKARRNRASEFSYIKAAEGYDNLISEVLK